MPSRFQPVEPFTLEALVTMQQWSALRSPGLKPNEQVTSSRVLRGAAAKAGGRIDASTPGAVESGGNK